MNNDFLQIADKDGTVSLLSEAKIIERFQHFNKAVMLTSNTLEGIQKAYHLIISAVKNQQLTVFMRYHVTDNFEVDKILLSKNRVNNDRMISIATEIINDGYMGYIFIVNRGFQCLYINGQFSYDIKNVLMTAQSAKEHYAKLFPVSALPRVFERFLHDCKHGDFYDECFQSDRKIKCSIKEQELRNILIKYLGDNVRGSVQSELCTDMENDEESVDIGLYDGIETAVIEVKFAFSEAYYAGKAFYKPADAAKKGYQQLNKYAIHLAKDERDAEYGYLYMFHMTEQNETDMRDIFDSVYSSLKDNLSSEFNSMYKDTVYNDMHTWGERESRYGSASG